MQVATDNLNTAKIRTTQYFVFGYLSNSFRFKALKSAVGCNDLRNWIERPDLAFLGFINVWRAVVFLSANQ